MRRDDQFFVETKFVDYLSDVVPGKNIFGQRLPLTDEYTINWDDSLKEYKKPACECGSEKTYGKDATHSTWCPKFEEFK